MQTAGGGGQALPCGIDLGNHSSKVGCLSRTGTQVIPNALSNRETPTLLSSGGGRRLAGEGALNQRTSNPAGTVWNIRALLGRRCSATEAPSPGGLPAGLQLGDYAAWQAFQLAPTAESGLAVQLESGALPLEGVAAACLGDCMATARLAASQGLVGEGVPLVALAAPAWGYTASQRAALVSAAAIAGIELAGVLSEPAATSLFYATERLPALLRELGGSDAEPQADETGIEEGDDDEVIILDDDDEGEDGPEAGAEAEVEVPGAVTAATVLFVDIGHGGTSASIVRFDGEARTVRVLDVAGAEVGGREIDVLLAERFVQIAEAAQPGLSLGPEAAVGGGDAARVARARARILTATDECKKVLSANDSDTTTLEELAEGLDVRCDTTREELEESVTSSGLLAAILKPVEDVLLRSVAADESIDAVELFGGTARVPLISTGVSALATEHMGAAIIRRSLNGSEAVARGCALYAAMALPTFNAARRIEVIDTSPYDMALVLSAPPPPAAAAKGEAAKLIDPKAVPAPAQEGAVEKPVLTVARGAALPTPIGGTPSARLRLSDLLEGRASAQLLYTNQDQLPPSVAEGAAATPLVAFTLEVADRDALSQEPAAQEEGQETKQAGPDAEAEYGFVLSAELELLCMQRSGPSCEILAVPMPGAGVMGAEALAEAARNEQEMATREAAVEAAEAARNELESAVYRYRDEILNTDLADEVKTELEGTLMACEDWLYEEETYDITDAAVFAEELARIQKLVEAAIGVDGGEANDDGDDDNDSEDPEVDDDVS